MTRPSRRTLVEIAIGCVLFGLLVAVRFELDLWWARALVTGCAGAVLGWMLVRVRAGQR